MEDAAGAEEFERAALHRDRLKAIRSLFERQRVAGGSVGTADLIGVAVEGADANAQVFQVRDGILAERQSFYLENQAERDLAEVAEEFIGQYYSASPAMPRTIVVGPYLRERAAVLAEALSERRGSPVEVRAAERGDKRRLRELAERNARLALDQDRLRREHRRARRVESLGRARARRSGWRSCRCGSRASTSPTSAASTPSPRWSCSRAARRRRPTTGASKCAASCATPAATAAPTTSPRWRRC